MNNKIILQFNNNIIENLLKDNEKLKYLLCHLNLVQDIPNQALYISNDRLDSNLIKKNMLKSVKDKKLIDYPVLIHNINLSNNINPFKSLDKKRNESLRKRKFSIKKNRKINGRKLLEKKEKFYNMYSNNYFIAKKKEINKGKTLNYIYGKNINIKKMNTKRNSFYGNLKGLNSKVISKYNIYQKEKGKFKIKMNSYPLIDYQINSSEKVKNFFKGKYFKNFYQMINDIQNNLREYVNYENHEVKQDQLNFCNKLFNNISFKNTKPVFINSQLNKKNTHSLSLSQTNLSEKTTIESIEINSNKVNSKQSLFYEISNKTSDKASNLNISNISFNSNCLSPKVVAANAVTTTINVENPQNNNKFKTELNQSLKFLKDSTKYQNQIQKENINNDDNKISGQSRIQGAVKDVANNERIETNDLESLKKQNINESTSSKDVIEKSIILPSSEISTPSLKSSNSSSMESIKSMSNVSSTKRNRRSKHNRSSAVCLSSKDIKGILDQTKKDEVSTKKSLNSYTMERSLNDSIKYQKGYYNPSIPKDSLERRKLLSRNNYHPSLATLSSTQFCYSDYYPTIQLPIIPRSSSFYSTQQSKQQPWINRNKLNV